MNKIEKLLDLIPVPGGTFQMGSPADDVEAWGDEKPQHSVTLSGFQIGKYPVTQRLWKEIMGNSPSHFKGDDLPVENVSWNDIQIFLEKLNVRFPGRNFRLPTEAEWEYAARGGNLSKGYKYAGSDELDEVAWYKGNSGDKTHPVGQKKPNELGLYDMSGNVWEWCSDWHGPYPSGSQTNPVGPDGGGSGVRRGGGCWYVPRGCRVAYRGIARPAFRYRFIGFRLAASFQSDVE